MEICCTISNVDYIPWIAGFVIEMTAVSTSSFCQAYGGIFYSAFILALWKFNYFMKHVVYACNSSAKEYWNIERQKWFAGVINWSLCLFSQLTCNWVNILVDPVICWFNFKKCPISRLNSFRFMLSNSDIGTKRSKPNSRLFHEINKRHSFK